MLAQTYITWPGVPYKLPSCNPGYLLSGGFGRGHFVVTEENCKRGRQHVYLGTSCISPILLATPFPYITGHSVPHHVAFARQAVRQQRT